MKKTVFIFLVMISLLSCSNGKDSDKQYLKQSEQDTTEQVPMLKKDSVDFSLDTFSNIPKEIDGCGCYFYLSKQDERSQKYIFVNDFASIAFISINGNVEKFELKEHGDSSNVYLYSNGQYKLKIKITKKEDSGNETSIMTGVIRLSKGNSFIEKEFTGFCGC